MAGKHTGPSCELRERSRACSTHLCWDGSCRYLPRWSTAWGRIIEATRCADEKLGIEGHDEMFLKSLRGRTETVQEKQLEQVH